ncbi:hypothetical protein FD754_020416 [Muntiacus muntjak]|uniref:C2H2-type domain-containing protein n=1 Tax=Muntiacus muntjak TaxID=9888 RepID=A0A5N3V4H8_MUNMU|nr:hypothetical protein FD754_020416 [Muntiacus muntjak]
MPKTYEALVHLEQKSVRQIFNSVLSRALNLKVQVDPRMHLSSLLRWLSQPSLPGMGCSEYDEEEVDYEESDSDESWTTESAISSEAILSSMCMNGGEEKPFACPVPGCKKRYKNVNGIKYHAKNGHRTQIRVRKPFKCRCGKSYKTAQGLRHHTINFHPPVSAEIIRKMQQ